MVISQISTTSQNLISVFVIVILPLFCLISTTVGHAFYWNNGQPFSMHDQDNDDTSTYNCAEEHRGAWWYKYVNAYCYFCWKWPADNPCSYCTDSNLNGDYQESGVGSIFLYYSNRDPNRPECGFKWVEMKLRPI